MNKRENRGLPAWLNVGTSGGTMVHEGDQSEKLPAWTRSIRSVLDREI